MPTKKKPRPKAAKAPEPQRPLRLEWRSPAELAENPANWRRHPESQLAALTDIIAEVGWAGVCLFNELTGRLIDGHARRKVAIDQGAAEVPVLIGSWTEEQERKILATFDPIGARAETDPAALTALLADMESESAAVAALLAELAAEIPLPQPGGGGDEFDATPEPSGPTRTSVGDLWVIGGVHRLLVGDCTDAGNVVLLMNGVKVGACISDPPYGIAFDTDYTRFTVQKHHNINHGGSIKGDEKPFDPAPFLEYPAVVLWGANCFSQRLPLGSWLVWDKRFDNGEAWLADAEVAWMRGGHGVYIHKETTQGFVRTEAVQHPTQKPIGVMKWCIEKSKTEGIIFDPFLGSGATLIAAHRLNRVCYGCEIEPKYADVILRRAEAEGLTCEKAG